MKKTVVQLILAVFAITLLSHGAFAKVNIDKAGLANLEKVAVVGYSFNRDLEEQEFNPFKKQQKDVNALTPESPEFIMIQLALPSVLEILQKGGAFEVIPQSEVFENDLYQSSTKDPSSKLSISWYFPDQYRVIKLKKENAIALSEALGVDAVIQVAFTYSVTTSSSNTLGIFGKKKKFNKLKGKITVIDKTGRMLISGSVKSDKKLKKKTKSFALTGTLDNGVAFEPSKMTPAEEFYADLLRSFLEKLNKGLGYD